MSLVVSGEKSISLARSKIPMVLFNNSSQDLVQRMGSFITNKANRSHLTAKTYLKAINGFVGFLNARNVHHPNELSSDHVVAYVSFLQQKNNYSVNSIRKIISAISSWSKWMSIKGFVKEDICYGVERPKEAVPSDGSQPKSQKGYFTKNEIKNIFSSLEPTDHYYRAILAVGFYSGLRSKEIRNLRLEDITTKDGHNIIKTIIKGNKEHEVPVSPFLKRAIKEHIDYLQEQGRASSPESFLFPSIKRKKDQAISYEGLNYILQKAVKKASIDVSKKGSISPHSMRSSLATHLLNDQDVPLERVQKLLGHSDTKTTQIYDRAKTNHDKSAVYKIDF